jgi:hypothetical protein
MKGHRIVLSFFVTLVALWGVAPATAHAQLPGCSVADFVLLGERAQYDVAANNSIFLKTRVVSGRSYHVMAWGPFGGGTNGEDDIDISVGLFTDATCTTPAQTVSTTAFEPEPNAPGHVGAQASLIPTATGPLYIQVHNNTASAAPLQAIIVETTLFSPWWFTGGTNQAFIEVTNNMDTATTAVVTVRKADGSTCGTSNVPLAAGGNAAVSVKALGTCANASGSAQIAFNGTPGGLTANTTTIDGIQGTSFDSPFVPRMTWSLLAR